MRQTTGVPLYKLNRATALKIAAVLSVLVGVIGIVFYDLPNLTLGASASESPFWMVIGSFVTDILALVAAYGAWRGQKWGAVLLILVNAFWILQAVGTLLFGTTTFDFVFSSLMLLHHICVVTLCLWRERNVTTKQV
jgi:hypothetical protein